MFSSDHNIESIAQLVEAVKRYISIKSEYLRLDIVEKSVRIITVLAMTLLVGLIVTLMLVFASIAGSVAIGYLIGSMPLGFLIVSGIYLLLLATLFIKRKAWIERPLVRFIASILLE